MYVYKKNIVEELKSKGYTSYKIKQNSLLSQGTLKKLENEENVTLDTLNAVCCMLKCDISDVIEIVVTDEEKIKYF